MLETDIRKIQFHGDNYLKVQHVNLDEELDIVLLVSCDDEKLAGLLDSKILDAMIDRIHPKNVYKDFSSALENINNFLGNWKSQQETIQSLSAIIGVYYKKTFYFSTIGKASCYLYNSNGEIIEVSDKNDSPTDFNFISSGDIWDGESLILASMRLLEILSSDDLKDGVISGHMKRSGENIEYILLQENIPYNIGVASLQKEFTYKEHSSEWMERAKYYTFKIFDNDYAKRVLGYIYHLRDKLSGKGVKTQQLALWGILIGGTIFLYVLVSGFLHVTSQTQSSEDLKQALIDADTAITTASENINNEDIYTLNMESAEELIKQVEQAGLYLGDVAKLKDEMNILQKQYNGIESFTPNTSNTLTTFESPKNVIKLVSVSDKLYGVFDTSVYGPILTGVEPKLANFTELSGGDRFIDATVVGDQIVLITSQGKVVNYTVSSSYFSYVDVTGQDTWEKSSLIEGYAANIYMLSDSGNQILRHVRQGETYSAGDSYLSDADANSMGKIKAIAVDGGIYILKSDGSMLKLFRSPSYRLESLALNKLPKNYSITDTQRVQLAARIDLNYVYLLVDNRLMVFKPNSNRWQDTKSLDFIGQIEGNGMEIESFYVQSDWKIQLISKDGVFTLDYTVTDSWLVISS